MLRVVYMGQRHLIFTTVFVHNLKDEKVVNYRWFGFYNGSYCLLYV